MKNEPAKPNPHPSLEDVVSLKLSQIIQNAVQLRFVPFILKQIPEMPLAVRNGLRLLGAILKTKGAKKFRPQKEKPQKFLSLEEIRRSDPKHLEELLIEFRRKLGRSSYKQHYQARAGGSTVDLYEQSLLLKYFKFSELNIAKPLEEHAVLYIQNWVDLKDQSFYQNLVLQAVRWVYVQSLNVERAETTSKESFASLHKTHYLSFKRIDKIYNNTLSKTHSAPRIKCLDDNTSLASPTLLRQQRTQAGLRSLLKSSSVKSLQRPSQPWSLGSITKDSQESLKRSLTAESLQKLLSPDWRKKQLMRGSGNITAQAAASPEPVCSTYKSTYSQGFNYRQQGGRVKRTFLASFSSGGIIPDPTMR